MVYKGSKDCVIIVGIENLALKRNLSCLSLKWKQHWVVKMESLQLWSSDIPSSSL